MANAGGKLDGRLDQDDDDDIPSAAECARRCKEFVDLTKTDSALAQSFLQDRQWSVEMSVAAYYEEMEVNKFAGSRSATSPGRTSVAIDLNSVPDALKRDALCEMFATVTGTNTEIAMPILAVNNWDLDRSVQDFLDSNPSPPPMRASASHSTTSSSLARTEEASDKRPHCGSLINFPKKSCTKSILSTMGQSSNGSAQLNGHTASSGDPECDLDSGTGNEESNIFKLISWNIDGLDSQNIGGRAAAVAAEIIQEQPDVVFLQEVVEQNLKVLQTKIGEFYQFVTGGNFNYFTAILVKKKTVLVQSSSVVAFPATRMARNLICMLATWNKVPLTLMTAHLESCKEAAEERQTQLGLCFQRMLSQADERVVIFGGDLNLRDPELKAIQGIPATVKDLWSECGARPECKATWDAKRNTNTAELCQDFKFKPQCRFDRLYYRPTIAQACPLVPSFFGLVGITKVPNSQRYPSDHWGIVVRFDRKNGGF